MSGIRKVPLSLRSNAFLAAVLCLLLPSCTERDLQDAKEGDAGGLAQESSVLAPLSQVSFQLGEAITTCNIETVNGVSADGADVSVDAGQSVVVEGWVLAPGMNPDADSWVLHLQAPDGQLFAVAAMERLARPDLVGRSSEARAAMAGFRAEFRLPQGAEGRAGLFLAPTSGAVRPTCALGRGIVAVRP